ncbi:methyltransferase [Streptomyces sp. NPDC006512]|uniref:class I SAM-dependent methyltransferase n=1 Tax=Streptomyces sp. NPDC006512 TaxID=3154307 RepID=UPI0033A4CCCB
MSTKSHVPGPAYAFDNSNEHAAGQHDSLARLLDPLTCRRLAATGIRSGWRCLEVGAGGGSVALWLAAHVAPGGSVLATDIAPHHIPDTPGLTVQTHDITTDPLPESTHDLVHARFVLSHLPDRRAVLGRLLRTLKPGGVLQIDELDTTHWPVVTAYDEPHAQAYTAYRDTLVAVLRQAGADPTWGPGVAPALVDAGFTGIDAHCHTEVWDRTSPGAALMLSNSHHLEPALLGAGLDRDTLHTARAAMRHDAFRAVSFTVHTVQARRP